MNNFTFKDALSTKSYNRLWEIKVVLPTSKNPTKRNKHA